MVIICYSVHENHIIVFWLDHIHFLPYDMNVYQPVQCELGNWWNLGKKNYNDRIARLINETFKKIYLTSMFSIPNRIGKKYEYVEKITNLKKVWKCIWILLQKWTLWIGAISNENHKSQQNVQIYKFDFMVRSVLNSEWSQFCNLELFSILFLFFFMIKIYSQFESESALNHIIYFCSYRLNRLIWKCFQYK